MKNIIVSIDDESYHRARIRAAQQGTSVSALIERFLTEFASGESDRERLKREERELRSRVTHFRAGDRRSRHDVHGRNG
jgi:hypothetical protein